MSTIIQTIHVKLKDVNKISEALFPLKEKMKQHYQSIDKKYSDMLNLSPMKEIENDFTKETGKGFMETFPALFEEHFEPIRIMESGSMDYAIVVAEQSYLSVKLAKEISGVLDTYCIFAQYKPFSFLKLTLMGSGKLITEIEFKDCLKTELQAEALHKFSEALLLSESQVRVLQSTFEKDDLEEIVYLISELIGTYLPLDYTLYQEYKAEALDWKWYEV